MSLGVALSQARRDYLDDANLGVVYGYCSACSGPMVRRYCESCDDVHSTGHKHDCMYFRVWRAGCIIGQTHIADRKTPKRQGRVKRFFQIILAR